MQDIQTTEIGNLIEPDPIGFAFGAPGWYMLGALALLLLIIYTTHAIRKYRKDKYRRAALKTLQSLNNAGLTTDQYVFRILEVLKRVSLTSFGRSYLAPLNGLKWVHFLDQRNGKPVFSKKSMEIVTIGLYQGKKVRLGKEESQRFYDESIKWIKEHRV